MKNDKNVDFLLPLTYARRYTIFTPD